MIYVTSDWHFNHKKPFLYAPRGFATVEEMNEGLIQNYNSIVKPDDDVYVLGDLCLGGAEKLEENEQLLKRLNGHIHIVRGNHDTDKKMNMYSALPNVVEIQNSIYLKYEGFHFYLSHFPSMTTNFDDNKGFKHRLLNLCGHSHTDDKWLNWFTGSYHCEVDAHENFPVSIDIIIEDYKALGK